MKKIKNTKDFFAGLILCIILYVFCVFCAILMASCTSQPATAKQAIPEIELHKSQSCNHLPIIKTYSNVLHRIWVDNPNYVEDILWEYDEMLKLDELLNGEWGKTFEFWTEEDSIAYSLNWEHVDKITNLKCKLVKPCIKTFIKNGKILQKRRAAFRTNRNTNSKRLPWILV